MKLALISVFLVFFISNKTFAARASHPNGIVGVVKTKDEKGLRLRACPSTECAVVDSLKEKKYYYFDNDFIGDWLKIHNKYAHKDYVKRLYGKMKTQNTESDLINELRVQSGVFKVLSEYNKWTKNSADVPSNYVQILSFERVTDSVALYSFDFQSVKYKGIFIDGFFHFIDGSKGYCFQERSRTSKNAGLIYEIISNKILEHITISPSQVFSFADFPYRKFSHSVVGHHCEIGLFNKNVDVQPYILDFNRVTSQKDRFLVSIRENPIQLDLSKKEKLKKKYVGFAPLLNENLTAAYTFDEKSLSTSRRGYFYYTSKKPKVMEIKGLIKDLDLNFKYKAFTLYYNDFQRGSYGDKYRGAIYAKEALEINGFKILKGEFVDLSDVVKLIYVAKKYPVLKKNDDYGFGRTVDEKNYSDARDLFFNLEKIHIESKLFAISPHYISFYDEEHGTIGYHARSFFGSHDESEIDSEFYRANKFLHQRVSFPVGYRPTDNEKAIGCDYTYSNLLDFEKMLSELKLTSFNISTIKKHKTGVYEVVINTKVDLYGVKLAPKSSIYIYNSPCGNAKYVSAAMAKQGSIWKKLKLKNNSLVFFEDKIVEKIFDDTDEIVFAKYKVDLGYTISQGFTRYPLCINNFLSVESGALNYCRTTSGHSSINISEIKNYNSYKQTVDIGDTTYFIKDITSLFVARVDNKEYWLPFLPDFSRYKTHELEKIMHDEHQFPLEFFRKDQKLQGTTNYCNSHCLDDSEHQEVNSVNFLKHKGAQIKLKLYDKIEDPNNVCSFYCS